MLGTLIRKELTHLRGLAGGEQVQARTAALNDQLKLAQQQASLNQRKLYVSITK